MPHDERSVSQFGSTYYSLSDIYFYLNKKVPVWSGAPRVTEKRADREIPSPHPFLVPFAFPVSQHTHADTLLHGFMAPCQTWKLQGESRYYDRVVLFMESYSDHPSIAGSEGIIWTHFLRF